MLMTKLTWPYIFIVQIMQNDEVVLNWREASERGIMYFLKHFLLRFTLIVGLTFTSHRMVGCFCCLVMLLYLDTNHAHLLDPCSLLACGSTWDNRIPYVKGNLHSFFFTFNSGLRWKLSKEWAENQGSAFCWKMDDTLSPKEFSLLNVFKVSNHHSVSI